MAQSRIQQQNLPDLIAALRNPGAAQGIESAKKGLTEGMGLADSVRKRQMEESEQAMKVEEFKAKLVKFKSEQDKDKRELGDATALSNAVTNAVPGADRVVANIGGQPVKAAETQSFNEEHPVALAAKVDPKKAADSVFGNAIPDPSKTHDPFPQQGSLEVRGDDGKTAIIPAPFRNGKYYYPNTDTEIPADRIVSKGYGLNSVKDASGNVMNVSRGSGSVINTVGTASGPVDPMMVGKLSDVYQLPGTKSADALKAINASQVDPAIKKEKEVYVGMNRLEKAIASNNQAVASKLGIVFQKALGDSGNIAVAEQRMPGSQQLLTQAVQAWNTYITTGTLSPENRGIVLSAVKVLKDVSAENYNTLVDIESDQVVSAFPELNQEYVRRTIGGGLVIPRAEATGNPGAPAAQPNPGTPAPTAGGLTPQEAAELAALEKKYGGK